MSTAQHAIPSKLGARTTAIEVVAGIDLSGTLAIVTGGYSGLGIETVAALVGAGATVIVPARRPEARVGPGRESRLATNHLGHYVLANLLWPALHRDGGARVIALSSTGHTLSGIRFDDPQFDTGYDKWQAYGQAKTADSLFAIELDRVGAPFGVRAFAVHPGGIMTALQRHLPREEMIASGWMTDDGTVNERCESPQEGAATSVCAATSPQLEGMGGVYCEDCDIAEPTAVGSPEARVRGVDAHAIDRTAATQLWALSAALTGVNAFA